MKYHVLVCFIFFFNYNHIVNIGNMHEYITFTLFCGSTIEKRLPGDMLGWLLAISDRQDLLGGHESYLDAGAVLPARPKRAGGGGY